jgi:hypothetical protein
MDDQSGFLMSREHKRFKVKQRALVFLPQGPEATPYHILDISEGGLSFSYLGEKINLTGTFPVDLYDDQELVVENLPVKAVSDCRLRDDLVPVRRGSFCFESLSPNQRNGLVTFIENCAEQRH